MDAGGAYSASFRPKQPSEHRLYGFIEFIAWIGIGAHSACFILFAWLDFVGLALINVASVAWWFGGWLLNRRGHHDAAIAVMACETVAHSIIATSTLGWSSGFAYYLLAVVPATTFIDRLRTSVTLAIAIALCLVFAFLYRYTGGGATAGIDPLLMEFVHDGNIAVVFAAIGVITFHFRRGSDAAEARMAHIAGTDQLTELPNRHRLDEVLEVERERCRRGGRSLTLVLTDIDHFKRVNDTLGHDAGDFVLRNVARVLQASLRQQDVAGRWGGEEFLLVLPETDLEAATMVAERVRAAVECAELEVEGARVPVTTTLGVAEWTDGASLEDVLKQADAALYRGKAAGRNRVVIAEPAVPPSDASGVPELRA